MKQILIATHGKMASGIQYTAELILGKMAQITTVDAYVNAEDDIEAIFREYFEAHKGDRIFVLTDMMGGSVNQKLMAYGTQENVVLITGTNLALLIQIMMADEQVGREEIEGYIEAARQELKLVSIGADPAGGEKEDKKESRVGQNEGAQETGRQSQPAAPQNFEHSNAKISALRIDDRLIHGQVAMTWTKQLRVQGIIVASDDAASDNTQKMALKMAVPAGIKVLIKPVDEAIRILNYEKASQMRILVLTRTVKDALKIRKQVGEISFLNLGNTGRFDGIDISEKQVITPTIMLTKAEMEALKELVELDPATCMQQVPGDERRLVSDVLAKL